MKLRIRGDSIRIRVTQAELREIAEHGSVRDRSNFGDGAALTYELESDTNAREPRARFAGQLVSIVLPAATVRLWASSGDVSIESEQPIGGGERLRILVEKDFACLQPRTGEDESDMFP